MCVYACVYPVALQEDHVILMGSVMARYVFVTIALARHSFLYYLLAVWSIIIAQGLASVGLALAHSVYVTIQQLNAQVKSSQALDVYKTHLVIYLQFH